MYTYYQQLATLFFQCFCSTRFGVSLRHHQELVYTLGSLYITSISLYTYDGVQKTPKRVEQKHCKRVLPTVDNKYTSKNDTR